MFTMQVTYTDFKGNTHTEDVEFNLSEGEVIELDNVMSVEFEGGLKTLSERIENGTITPNETLSAFEQIIIQSYGKTSEDGLYFEKKTGDDAVRFKNSAIFQAVFRKLITEPGIVDAFMAGILPSEDPYQKMLKANSRPKKAAAKRK